MTTITLKKPIDRANGETITELTLREPTAEEVAKIGYPFRAVPGSGSLEMLPDKALQYAALLSGYPRAVVAKVSIPDLMELQGVVGGFFGDTAETAET